MNEDDNLRKIRAQIVELCESILEGSVDLLQGIRWLNGLSSSLPEEERDSFSLITAIESQTDHIPIGSERCYCTKERCEQLDKEIERLVTPDKDRVFELCRTIIEKYS